MDKYGVITRNNSGTRNYEWLTEYFWRRSSIRRTLNLHIRAKAAVLCCQELPTTSTLPGASQSTLSCSRSSNPIPPGPPRTKTSTKSLDLYISPTVVSICIYPLHPLPNTGSEHFSLRAITNLPGCTSGGQFLSARAFYITSDDHTPPIHPSTTYDHRRLLTTKHRALFTYCDFK